MSVGFLINQSFYSGFNAFALDGLGVVQNLGQTIAPSLISAVGLGVIHRGIEKGSITLVDKVKEKLNIFEGQSFSKGIDLLQFAFDLASRYAVARVLNAVFGCKISTNYVHIYTALDLIRKSSSLTPFKLAIFGLMHAVSSRGISLFIAAPSFKNSFYFGGIFLALVYPVELNKPKIPFQVRQRFHIEDPRLLLISHVALNSFILATFLCSMKVCNRYFKLQIPRSFMIFIGVVQTISLLGISLLEHIGDDLLGVSCNSSALIDTCMTSGNVAVQEIGERVQQVVLVFDLDNLIGNSFMLNELPLVVNQLKTLFNCFTPQLLREWIKGTSINNINNIVFEETVKSNIELTCQVLDSIERFLGISRWREGSELILREILKEASSSTKQAFLEVNVERETGWFIATKAIAIYVVGSKKEEIVPNYFSEDSIEKIGSLRQKACSQPEIRSNYEEILGYLNTATKEEGKEDESFFKFAEKFQEDGPLMKALQDLKKVGYGELQQPFGTKSYNLAAKRLQRLEPVTS